MSIIATCGHKLTDKEEHGTTIPVKDYSRDCKKVISYTTLCDECLKWYRENGLELKTRQEQDKWTT